ncbi:MAG TPA: MBL fold metallo-hydrolase [Steroidobacteraceae bacterium]|nr:MBL fold metallo-hydrolase [Steroidobacteraceae bacterium]
MTEHRGAITSEGELYPSPRRGLDYLEAEPPAPGHAVPLGGGLYWARIPLPMELNHINVWLLEDDDGWLLVDTGMAEDVCREAWVSLEQTLLQGRPLRRIFVTHDHPDHMGLAGWLHRRHHGAPLWMSPVGHASTLEFLAASGDEIDARRLRFVTSHGMDVSQEAVRRSGGSEHGRWYGDVPPLARAVADGDRVEAGGRTWQVIETSGHCRGHLCLHDAANDVLITGDQVLPTISPNVSVLASRPDANPLAEYLESIARLERQCPPDTLVLPSHGRPFRGLHRRIEVLRSHHLQQLEALRAACRSPTSAYELLPVMYGRPLRGFHRYLAVGETVAHLNYLWHDGAVERRIDDAGRVAFVDSRQSATDPGLEMPAGA